MLLIQGFLNLGAKFSELRIEQGFCWYFDGSESLDYTGVMSRLWGSIYPAIEVTQIK